MNSEQQCMNSERCIATIVAEGRKPSGSSKLEFTSPIDSAGNSNNLAPLSLSAVVSLFYLGKIGEAEPAALADLLHRRSASASGSIFLVYPTCESETTSSSGRGAGGEGNARKRSVASNRFENFFKVGRALLPVRIVEHWTGKSAHPTNCDVNKINNNYYRIELIFAITLFYVFMSMQLVASDPEKGVEREIVETPLTESDRDHWSFQPIANAPLPAVQNKDWPVNEIDYFILADMETAKLQPATDTERPALLRRLKLDLLGLPPTIDELEAFESDSSPEAYERLVDRFLASPRFGERRAQGWLDLARFAETDGFEHDRVRKDAWQFRDWVIGALNYDMPYDQFIFKQLAGENDADPRQHIATMFCFAGPDIPDINDQDLRRHDRLNELTSTIGSALLGLQFHCAQCHDHKSDPISQADFYRLRAVFEPSVPDFIREKPFNVFTKESATIPARFYFRGDLQQPGPIVQAAMPRIATQDQSIHYCATSNPRAEFANWLFEKDHPLTARVMVNRLWQSHFGRGLFDSPSDVGIAPAGPTHPALLDWLATELRRNQWSLKSIQRKIVLSRTYRQRSFGEKGDVAWQSRIATDPKNRLYSRFPRHRIEAEVIRDSMLAVAGQLNFKGGGEGVMPPLPNELVGTLLKGQWKTSEDEADHWRRSVYVFARRNLRYPIFESFDRPDAGASCPKRDLSTTAIQSLQMFNSELTLECSKQLRQRILADVSNVSHRADSEKKGSIDTLIDRLFRMTLARSPSASEAEEIASFIGSRPAERDDQLLAMCLAILNTSEFIYVE